MSATLDDLLKELKRIRVALEKPMDDEGALLTYEEAVDLEPPKQKKVSAE